MSAEPAPAPLPFPERRARPRRPRELYLDAFRGLMALAMVQGHVFDSLISPVLRAAPLYQFQALFHGSTAPGFLFASGFVAGLPRAPLSFKASLRRARRLVFVWGVGYALHLPYFSLLKTAGEATPAERAALFACDALQVIAASQLGVLVLQWIFGLRWTAAAAAATVAVLAAGPLVWSSGVSAHVPLPLAAYLDMARAPSQYPVFPFAAFVLAGTVAGALIGRRDAGTRRRRSVLAGLALIAGGLLLSAILRGRVDFWGVSPAYVLVRLGGLLLVMWLVERAADKRLPGLKPLALLGHETLLVYVLHLLLLFGGVVWSSPLALQAGRLGYGEASFVLAAMVPVLLAAAWAWHRLKSGLPHVASLILAFLTVLFAWEFATRPW
jgi:fucose 4-O-acetylase-like acetyltransferase